MLTELLNNGFIFNNKHASAIYNLQEKINSKDARTPKEQAELYYCLGIAQLALALINPENEHSFFLYSDQNKLVNYTEEGVNELLQAASESFAIAREKYAEPIAGLDFLTKQFLPNLQTSKLLSDKFYREEEYNKLKLFFFIEFEIQRKLTNSDLNDSLKKDLIQLIETDTRDSFYLSATEIKKLIVIRNKYNKIERGIDELLLGQLSYARFESFLPLMHQHNLMDMPGILKIRSLLYQIPQVTQDWLLQSKLISSSHLMNIILSSEECGKSIIYILKSALKVHATTFEYLADQLPHPTLSNDEFKLYRDFAFKLSHHGEYSFDNTARVSSYISILIMMQHPQNRELSANIQSVIDLCHQAESKLELKTFAELINQIYQNSNLHPYFLRMLSWIPQLDKKLIESQLMHLGEVDWQTVQNFISQAIEQRNHQQQLPQDVDAVFEKFNNISSDVTYPLAQDELKELKTQFKFIKAQPKLSAQEQEDCFNKATINPLDPKIKLLLVATICHHFESFFDMTLYDEQVINVLALLNEPKRLAQIKTNEGKSTIIVILAAYFALCGRSVDIVSTNNELALRDVERFTKFYRSLNLTCGHNIRDENTEKDYQPHIIYGTNSDFEFSYLREATTGKDERKLRPYDVVIVDEVDSMFIDMQSNEAITSLSLEKSFSSDIYHKIWHWLQSAVPNEQTAEILQKQSFIPNTIPIAQLSRWLQSAKLAQQLALDKDYAIISKPRKIKKRIENKTIEAKDDKTIEVVDYKNTGQIFSGCRWQDGLHSFLEVKHGLEVEPETYSSGSISHIEFFNKYETLIGMSGTLGTQTIREELRTLYNVNYYDAAPHRPNRKTADPFIVSNDAEHFADISASTISAIQNKRAVLILCETIYEANTLYNFLKNKIKRLQLYTGLQKESATNILAIAGTSGMVTIATNNAGRGADIVVSEQAAEAGGLRLIITFKCLNYRVEWQAFSRTGRQDCWGTYQYVLAKNGFTPEELSHGTPEKIIEAWQKNREAYSDMESAARVEMHKLLHVRFLTQDIFFSLKNTIKLQLIVPWSMYKATIHEITNAYLNDPAQSLEDTIQAILTAFFKFWDGQVRKDSYFAPAKLQRYAVEVGNAEAISLFKDFTQDAAENKNSHINKLERKLLTAGKFFSSRPELTKIVKTQDEAFSEDYYSIHMQNRSGLNSALRQDHQAEIQNIMSDKGSAYFKHRAISRLALRKIPGGGGHLGALGALKTISGIYADCMCHNMYVNNVKVAAEEVLICHSGEYQSSLLLEAARAIGRGDSRRPELLREFQLIIQQIPEHKLVFALDSPDMFGSTARKIIESSDNEEVKKLIAKYKAPKFIGKKPAGCMSTLSFYGSASQKKIMAREALQFSEFEKIVAATPDIDETLLMYLHRIAKDKPANRIQVVLGVVYWFTSPTDPLALKLIDSLCKNDMRKELLSEKQLTDLFRNYSDNIEREEKSELIPAASLSLTN